MQKRSVEGTAPYNIFRNPLRNFEKYGIINIPTFYTAQKGKIPMKKILALLLAALLLTGCALVEAPPETTVPPVEVQVPYEETENTRLYEGAMLTFGARWDPESVEAQVLTKAARVFEATTGAAVEIRWPDGETAPEGDIFQITAAEFEEMDPETVLDLTQMAESTNFLSKSYESLNNQTAEKLGFLGALVQVPYLGGIYYNTEVFDDCAVTETPKSWEDYMSLCDHLYVSGWEPLAMDTDDAITALELHLRRFIGTEEIHRLMDKKGHWYEDEPAIAAFEQALLFAQAGFVCVDTPADYPAGQNKMALTNCAMMIGTNADCVDVEEKTLTDLSWGVFPYPGPTGSGIYVYADRIAISKTCENPQAAFDFALLLCSGEFDQLRADLTEGIPADPRNASPIRGAVEVLTNEAAEPVGIFGTRQQDAAVKLWTAWFEKATRHAIELERSKL